MNPENIALPEENLILLYVNNQAADKPMQSGPKVII